jgi:hypothetical protein
VEHPRGLPQELRVGDYMMWQTFAEPGMHNTASLEDGRLVFEYEVLTEQRSFPLILFLQREKVGGREMRDKFEYVLRTPASTAAFHDVNIVEYKCGWYPSGGLSQQCAADRVARVGDAGCWTTPCGWGMAFILNNYRGYADGIARCLAANTLDKASLDQIIVHSAHARRQIVMNQVMTHILAYAPADRLDQFIAMFDALDPSLVEKTYTLTLTPAELLRILVAIVRTFSLSTLSTFVPPRQLKLIARVFAELGREFATFGVKQAKVASQAGRGFKVVQDPAPASTRTTGSVSATAARETVGESVRLDPLC